MFTVAEGATAIVLARHPAYAEAKYRGEITVDDGLFDELKAALRALERYYGE